MKLSAYSKMMVSFHGGWDELHRDRPSVPSLMLNLVLPFSLLPAIMVLYAGHINGEYYAPGVSLERWNLAALLFFIAELVTVPLMAWVLCQIAGSKKLSVSFQDGFVLAAAAAMPLWASSLILFWQNLTVNLLGALFGMIGAFSVLYHGLPVMFGLDEDIESLDMAYSAISAGGAAWAILMALVIVPLLG